MSYRDLKSYQSATIIYDFTVEFVQRYIDPKSRTKDQMEQAARSGKQNIVEASNERTSKKMELKLLGVARGSQEELLNDYEDYLRQHRLEKWDLHSPDAKAVRNLPYRSDMTYQSYRGPISPTQNRPQMLCSVSSTSATFCLTGKSDRLRPRLCQRAGGMNSCGKSAMRSGNAISFRLAGIGGNIIL